MLIWLIVLGLLAVLAVSGYYKGAIRSMVSLVGLFIALMATMPLAPLLRPLLPKVGLLHPIWPYIVPPLTVFLLIVIIFAGIGFAVHHTLALKIKYSGDDFHWLRWQRMNQRLGIPIALLAGIIYSVLICKYIYVYGYPAVQIVSDDSPAVIRFLAKARQDLKESGLDRAMASMDPMPERFYQTVDLIGLVYHNYALQDRLMTYPAMLSLSQRQEFQDINTDVDLVGMMQTKAQFVNIASHPKILAVVNSTEIMQELGQLDLRDLMQYLRSAKSAKYDEERLLGKWQLAPSATLSFARKRNAEMSAGEMKNLKTLIGMFLSKVTFMATPDNKVIAKVAQTEEAKRMLDEINRAAQPPSPDGEGGPAAQAEVAAANARMMARYGNMLNRPRATPVEGAPAAASTPPISTPTVNVAPQGGWQKDGDLYKIELGEGNDKVVAEATTEEGRLTLLARSGAFAFLQVKETVAGRERTYKTNFVRALIFER
jgi:hypothetical protein